MLWVTKAVCVTTNSCAAASSSETTVVEMGLAGDTREAV